MKRKGLLLLIGFMGFVISFSSCKKSEEVYEFDIRGNWEMVIIIAGNSETKTITFSGSLTYGTFTDGVDSGTYNVTDKEVALTIDTVDADYGRIHWELSGVASSDDQMEGIAALSYLDQDNFQVSGTWIGNRQ